jgi:uncharacterized protein involved in outer membrane biogenesis
LIAVPVLLMAALVLFYLALDTWLESAGGKGALEKTLAKKTGMPVRLGGEFDVILFPVIGVSGKRLEVGGDAHGPFLVSGSYELEIALGPLLDKRLLIESVHLQDGTVFTERYSRETSFGDNGEDAGPLPEVRRLSLQDFQLVAGATDRAALKIRQLDISDFAAGRPTPLTAELDDLGRIEGELTWLSDAQRIEVRAGLAGWPPGAVDIDARIDLQTRAVDLAARFDPATAGDPVDLAVAISPQGDRWILSGLRLERGEQLVSGSGCLLQGNPASLGLELKAGSLDLERLAAGLETPGQGGEVDSEPSPGLALEWNMRLVVEELRARGAVARRAVLNVGAGRACTG